MKPILLQMKAFGPYAQLQTIDFRLLKEVNMFLIHGATGGGKTTILDAICYALYGDTSGNERDAESMRSHFAREDMMTEVKLQFKIKDREYFIQRIPAQERPKKTGEGFTLQNPVAELYRINGDDQELLASGVNKTRDKVIEIMGFDADQFRQVIMIPQGQFRRLLVAESEERQKILGEIFQTRKYKKVEEKLREEEKKLRDDVVGIKERRKEQIKNIKYKEGTLLQELVQKENGDVLQIINEVEATCHSQEEELIGLQEEIRVSKENIEELSGKITKAMNNRDKQNEKLRVEEKYKALISQQDLYREKEKEYNLAQSALPLYSIEQYISTLFSQKQRVEKEILGTKEEVEKLEKRHNSALVQMEACEKDEPRIKELEIQLHRECEEYRPKVITLTSMKVKEKEAKAESEKLKQREKALKEEKIKIEEELLQAEKVLSNRQGLNDKLRAYEVNESKMLNIVEQRKGLVRLEEKCGALRLNYKEVNDHKKRYEGEYAKASQVHNDLLQQWIKGQASVLAKTLKENQPCPVCGSIDHPNPSQLDGDTPSEQLVNEKKAELDKAHTRYLEAESQRVRIATEGKASAEQVEVQKEVLGEYAQVSLEEIEEAYQGILTQKKQIHKELEALKKLEQKVAIKTKQRLEIEASLAELQQVIGSHTEKRITFASQITQIEQEIPTALQDREALEEHITHIGTILDQMKDHHRKTKEELESIVGSKIEIQTRLNEKSRQLEETALQYERESQNFKVKSKQAGFETFQAYQDAYKSEETLKELEKGIKNYYKEFNGLEAQYNQLKEETKDMILLNIEELQVEQKTLGELRDHLSRKHQSIIDEKVHNETQIKIILNSEKKIKDKEKKYSIVGDLYKAAMGKNIRGLSFERFIQSSLFEDILLRANERLQLMSNNRYELYRSDNRKTMSSQSGLEMEVLDTYTGKKRHVRTLSGGEGFMASLSLALGLADVVQSYAGGISLDTIFIDEGFGTLDSESLDSAIKTLIDLQQSGRLVGIISHVPELKERIRARIEVVRSQRGSQAIFHV